MAAISATSCPNETRVRYATGDKQYRPQSTAFAAPQYQSQRLPAHTTTAHSPPPAKSSEIGMVVAPPPKAECSTSRLAAWFALTGHAPQPPSMHPAVRARPPNR